MEGDAGMISRRGLITGLISFVAAPAIVRASSLMPVKNMLLEATDWKIVYIQQLNKMLDDVYRRENGDIAKHRSGETQRFGFGWASMKDKGTAWRLAPIRQEMDQAAVHYLRIFGPISGE